MSILEIILLVFYVCLVLSIQLIYLAANGTEDKTVWVFIILTLLSPILLIYVVYNCINDKHKANKEKLVMKNCYDEQSNILSVEEERKLRDERV